MHLFGIHVTQVGEMEGILTTGMELMSFIPILTSYGGLDIPPDILDKIGNFGGWHGFALRVAMSLWQEVKAMLTRTLKG